MCVRVWVGGMQTLRAWVAWKPERKELLAGQQPWLKWYLQCLTFPLSLVTDVFACGLVTGT